MEQETKGQTTAFSWSDRVPRVNVAENDHFAHGASTPKRHLFDRLTTQPNSWLMKFIPRFSLTLITSSVERTHCPSDGPQRTLRPCKSDRFKQNEIADTYQDLGPDGSVLSRTHT